MLSLMDGIYNNDTRELTYQIGTDSQTQKTNFRLPKGKVRAGVNVELGVGRSTTAYKR